MYISTYFYKYKFIFKYFKILNNNNIINQLYQNIKINFFLIKIKIAGLTWNSQNSTIESTHLTEFSLLIISSSISSSGLSGGAVAGKKLKNQTLKNQNF